MSSSIQFTRKFEAGFEACVDAGIERSVLIKAVGQTEKSLRFDPRKIPGAEIYAANKKGRIRVYKLILELGKSGKAALFYSVKSGSVYLLDIQAVDTDSELPIEVTFPESRITDRDDPSEKDIICHLAGVWTHFGSNYIDNSLLVNASLKTHIKLNKRFLVEVAKHARIDIDRMARWHLPRSDQQPDRHKYAGFLSRWVAQIRPVYIDADIPLESATLHTINARLALWVFRSMLHHPIPPSIAENLVYLFHYRQERGETLALIAYCCEEMSRQADSSTL